MSEPAVGVVIDPDGHAAAVSGPVGPGEPVEPAEAGAAVTAPAKVMRIGTMVKQLLDEVHAAPLDERSRQRLREVHERSIVELSDGLSAELQEELRRLALPFTEDEIPSESELRVAQAQLVGWLEGVFHGLQAAMMSQQLLARAQVEAAGRNRQLAAGRPEGGGGQYL